MLLTFIIALVSSGHVGSPDAFYEGRAGPYPIRVIIRAPQVIPARAEIIVRTPAPGIRRVTATPYLWNSGERGAPPPDALTRVPGDSTLWSVQLWFMRPGSYAVRVQVEGGQGTGTALVPFAAVATAVLGMNRGLGIGLAGLGVFLVVGLVTIVGAAAREATLEPGVEPDPRRIRRSWLVRGLAAVVLIGLLLLGRAWWGAEHRAYAEGVYHNGAGRTTIVETPDGRGRLLRFAITPEISGSLRYAPLVPDHGKLMHLFLVRGDLGALAHLHPVARDSLTFEAVLPVLPAGRYQVYADIVHESGFAETIVSTVAITEGSIRPPVRPSARAPADADDAAFAGAPSGLVAAMGDGTTLTWDRGDAPLLAGEDGRLRFTLRDATGAIAPVEPYLGMAAHAALVRDDQSVFIHLHPVGTAPMVARQALEAWTPSDTTSGAVRARLARLDTAMTMHESLPGSFAFPYAFPRAGRYRVWVQLRRAGVIHTAVFEARVS